MVLCAKLRRLGFSCLWNVTLFEHQDSGASWTSLWITSGKVTGLSERLWAPASPQGQPCVEITQGICSKILWQIHPLLGSWSLQTPGSIFA